MNHVYKTVLNKVTGLTCVVSEKGKSSQHKHSSKGQSFIAKKQMIKTERIMPVFKLKKLLSCTGLTLIGTLLSSMSFAVQDVYDGSQTLSSSKDIHGALYDFLSGAEVNGYIVQDESNTPAQGNTDLKIDYSTGNKPQFIVAGYAGLFGSTETQASVENNSISINQGAIQANVYAGLAHYTENKADVVCNKNNCTVESDLKQVELHSNKNTINYIKNDTATDQADFYAGTSSINQIFGDVMANGDKSYMSATAKAKLNNGQFSSQSNTITLSGDKNQIKGNFSAGLLQVKQKFGDIKAGHVNDNYALAEPTIKDNTLTASDNQIALSGLGNNIQGHLTAGLIQIQQNIGRLEEGSNASNNARGRGRTAITSNTLTNNKNKIEISNEDNTLTGNINVGINQIGASIDGIHGVENALAEAESKTYSNELSSIENSIEITAKNNTIQGDLNVGISNISHNFAVGGDNAYVSKIWGGARGNNLNSNNNKIKILADDISIQGGLNAGLSHIEQIFGDFSRGKIVHADVDGTKMSSNNNHIEIAADNITVLGNIYSGSSRITNDFGTFKAGDHIYSYLNASKLESNDNSISIVGSNNTIDGDIVAGHTILALKGKLEKGATSDLQISSAGLNANNNNITLAGDLTLKGSIYAGYVGFDTALDGTVAMKGQINNVNATKNTINIDGNLTLNNKDSSIYGGYFAYDPELGYQMQNYDVFTGNTLNYNNRTSIKIGTIANFETYNFTIAPEFGNTDTALINAEHIVLGTNSGNISKNTKVSNIYVKGIHSGKAISTGTEFILMQGNIEGSGLGHDTQGVKQENVQQGISLLYDVQTKVDANTGKVTATIISGHDEPDNPDPKVNPQLKSLLEGNLASLMLLTRSADNLAYNTFSAINMQNQKRGLVPFVQMSGHHARYNSGSHINANGGLVTAGISFQNDKLTLAIFSENGWGEYDSHNTFVDAKDVNATGNNRFNGGGLYGQYDFNNGLYSDASIRAGRLHTSYKTEDIRNAVTDEAANYKLNNSYIGAHIGVGYQFEIDALNRFDLSFKYLWSGTDAKDILVTGDPIHFDRLNSSRLRIHGDNNYQFNPSWSVLFGTGLEYEFDGVADGTTYQQFAIDAPSVKGLTALGTLGLRYQPIQNKRFTLNFIGNGYVGKRDGGGATLHMQYAF